MRKTKIIATLGPASRSPAVLQRLIEAGVNVCRINASHASHADIRELTEQIHRLGRLMKHPVAVLLDLCGPKVRLGSIEATEFKAGTEFYITGNQGLADPAKGILPCNHPRIAEDVKTGHRVLIDDGLLEFDVLGIEGELVHLRAQRDGLLKPRKGINLPDSVVSIPALTPKDIADLEVGVDAGVDYVAISFVQNAQDVQGLRDELKRLHAPELPIIAKIEKPQAVEPAVLDEILKVAEGVMVARGDLGVETGPHKVAVLQKQIIAQCHKVGAIDIVATQMLDSMERNPMPTRAEANDVGNSILDGVDAVMLSGETAAGKYPIEAVTIMARIATEVESADVVTEAKFVFREDAPFPLATQEVAKAAARIAEHPRYKGLIVLTATSRTARIISACFPRPAIFGLTPSMAAYRRMALLRGVQPVHMRFDGSAEHILREGERLLLEQGLLQEGDHVVVVSGTFQNPGAAHMVKIMQMGQSLKRLLEGDGAPETIG